MAVGERTHRWLLHRYGTTVLDSSWPYYQTRALELNRTGPDFTTTFGTRTVIALIGFLDLMGFSDRVKGASPAHVAEYVLPFLDRITGTVVGCRGLVDKTIGDEVMFVLPEFEPEGGVPLMLAAPDLVRRLWVIRDQLASSHPFRVSLSVGMVYVGQVEGEGYSEWSIFGEAVNLAKRAAVLLSTADAVELGAGGALGVLVREEKSQEYFDVLLRHFTLKGSWPQAKVVADPPPLKGISQYRCVLLV